MENSCANLTGAVRLVRLIKVEGFSAKVDNNDCIKSAWSVDGYDWEIRVYPAKIMFAAREFDRMWVVVELVSININCGSARRYWFVGSSIRVGILNPQKKIVYFTIQIAKITCGSCVERSWHQVISWMIP
jgi:hypothetical protein